MKASELRIGNWIEWDDDSHEQVQVEIIEKSTHGNWFVNGGLLDDFLPIPLTKEWFKKFNIEYIEEYQCWKVGYYMITKQALTTISDEEVERFVYDNDGDCIVLESVHNLQNLYFVIYGKEIEDHV